MKNSKIIIADFNRDFNLGLYGFASDRYLVIGKNVVSGEIERSEAIKKIKVIRTLVSSTNLAGIFLTGNSCGMIASKQIPRIEKELEHIKENILFLDTEYTALGNLILINDRGCVISPLIKKHKKDIERFFGIECENIMLSVLSL